MAGADPELVAPRPLDADEVLRILPADVPRPPKLLRITEFLRMDVAT